MPGYKMIVKLVSFLELPYELCLNVRLWRNSPQVAEFSKNKVITEEEHRKWLENMKLDKPKHLALMIFISQYGNRLNEQLLNNIVEIHQKFIINSKINSKINRRKE